MKINLINHTITSLSLNFPMLQYVVVFTVTKKLLRILWDGYLGSEELSSLCSSSNC